MLGGCVEPSRLERQWRALDRPASAEVWATTERTAAALLEEFPQAMERVQAVMSARTDSELVRLNREAFDGYYRVGDRDLFRAVALAVDYAKLSEGAYDPTIAPVLDLYDATPEPDPGELASALEQVGWDDVVLEREIFAVHFLRPGMRLTLDGLLEGYAIDVAARKFVRTGSLAGVLRLGPHLYAWGDPPGREDWWVDVPDPRAAEPRPLLRLRIESSRGVGLSDAQGAAGLVLDPRTGRPAAGDTLVAVAIADSVADAIAVSRALLVGGTSRAGLLLSEKTRRVEAVMVVRGEQGPAVLASASLQGNVELPERLSGGLRFLLPPADLKGRLD